MLRAPLITACAGLILLAGCANFSDPRPESVTVSSSGVEARMSDGALCLGPRPDAALAWSGQLEGCATPYAYEARIDSRSNILRTVLEEIFDAIGYEDGLAPIAMVEITDAAGRSYSFASPPPPLEE